MKLQHNIKINKTTTKIIVCIGEKNCRSSTEMCKLLHSMRFFLFFSMFYVFLPLAETIKYTVRLFCSAVIFLCIVFRRISSLKKKKIN